MGNDGTAPTVLADEKGNCEYPVHALLAERQSLLAFASTPIEVRNPGKSDGSGTMGPFFNERTAVEFSRGHEGKQARF
jgi:hypothetical protein